jgi:LysM repeat protein
MGPTHVFGPAILKLEILRKMANLTANPVARAALLLSLSAVVMGCNTLGNNGPEPIAAISAESKTTVADRFSEEGSYTTVVPRNALQASQVNPQAPNRYEVVRGDTLWDISDRFLNEPWLWPQLWDYNPQIKNPHLIYPGDEIALEYVNGRPRLVIERDGKRVSASGTVGASASLGNNPNNLTAVRLSPTIRSESLDDAIPMIPGDAIESFLVHPRVVSNETIRNAPYVVGNYDDRLTSAIGHQIYVRGPVKREQTQYSVFRKIKALKDPITGKSLGFEIQHVSDVKLLHMGDPATLVITSNKMETIAGDILLDTNTDSYTQNYTTRMPALQGGDARVVSLVNSISQSGRDQVVVLNLGEKNSIRVGDVLAIESHGKSFVDKRGKRNYETVSLPNTRTGVVMVFKTFDDVSYALVMESTLPVRINDIVTGI